ncbi:MAG: hypothetical protein SOW36_01215 [Porphyromonas sp.]|uniref:hypothetical protein n=1 Tax=Porphyromonas sp. TaxID=1924944 RepID=UPI002A75ABA5|nr:hypothetical protein [Porphyromonas sp.]MDD6927689.1 hypothetical protein [Bacteroidales bacterium]MDY3111247.1 hypothetical protein [Porphyromonas sp.]
MKQVKQNPYRLLGIYANATTKERLANQSRLQAFLKVGKSVSFPLDLTSYLGEVERSEAIIATASAHLTLPQDQIRYAQFWFVKDTPIDTVAFNHLESGDLAQAVEIWEQRETPSSLQNLIICSLIREEYAEALSYAERLYGDSEAVSHFVALIVGDEAGIESDHIGFDFLDALCEELGGSQLLPLVSSPAWQEHLKDHTVAPLISAIQEAIEEAQKERKADKSRGASAGNTLYKKSKSPLAKLKKLLSTSDTQYQLIADKLGLEILQCAIDYYNDADDIEAARETARLAKYASSIVVGKLAKDRCQENLQTIERIIESLPPDEVAEEVMAIVDYLQEFNSQPSKVDVAVTLLESTRPHFQAIKKKLGATNKFYLKLSTKVVDSALHDIIEEVNDTQESVSDFRGIMSLKECLSRAWRATLLMDSFDMEEEFKHERYSPNRSTLKDVCEQLHIDTSSSTPTRVTTSTPQRATSSSTPRRATSPTPQTSFTESESKRASKEREKRLDKRMKAFGYAILFVVYGIILSLIIGVIYAHSNDNDDFGSTVLSCLFLCAIIGAFVGWNKGN